MQQPEHVKGTIGRSLATFKVSHISHAFFFICFPITLYFCVFVRPSVMLVEIPVVSTYLSLCLSISLPACVRACTQYGTQ